MRQSTFGTGKSLRENHRSKTQAKNPSTLAARTRGGVSVPSTPDIGLLPAEMTKEVGGGRIGREFEGAPGGNAGFVEFA
jgi:hypothetical protein